MAVYIPKMVCCSMVGFLLSAWPCLSIAATGNSGVASIDAAEQQAQAKQQAIQMNAAASAPVVSLGKTEKVSESASIIPMDEEGFRIHHIQIQSTEPFFQTYQFVVAPYEGYRIGQKGINQIVHVLTNALFADGYITSQVSVPDQDLQSGTLLLTIHHGRIERIQFKEPVAWGTWHTAFPVSNGDLLNVRALEQGLEQMKQVANQDVTMQLQPGHTPYSSIVELQRTESSPITMGLSVDNYGYKATGRWESTLNASWYNPLGLNDVLAYSYTKDIEHDDARLGSSNYYASYSIPFGWYTLSATAYRNQFRQTIATIQPYLSQGTTTGQSLSLERVIHRDDTKKTSWQVQVLRRERHNYIDGEEIDIQKQKTTALAFGIRHRQYAGQTRWDWYGYYRKGVGGWGAEKQPWEDGISYGTPRYGLWGTEFNLSAPVTVGGRSGTYTMRLVGQYASMRLTTADQISIGGHYTVRGFDGERNLSGEYGLYMQQEVAVPLDNGHWTPYIGVDAGFVGGPSTKYEIGRALVGAVIGLRGQWGTHVGFDVNIGTPLYKPQGFKIGKTIVGVSIYAQL